MSLFREGIFLKPCPMTFGYHHMILSDKPLYKPQARNYCKQMRPCLPQAPL